MKEPDYKKALVPLYKQLGNQPYSPMGSWCLPNKFKKDSIFFQKQSTFKPHPWYEHGDSNPGPID